MKVLFVGLGGIGQRHLRNLLNLRKDLEIIAFRERNSSKVINEKLLINDNEDVIKKYNIKVFFSLDAALAEKPKVAFICNPTSKHLEVSQKIAESGCDLFIEKALSNSLDGVDALIRKVIDKKLVCMVGYQMRYHPCLKFLRENVVKNTIGSIISVNLEVGEYMPGWHKYEDYRNLYASRSDLGGGVVISQIHEYDYLLWIFGFPHKVYAVGGHLSTLEIDVEDLVSVSLECVNKDGKSIPVHLHQDFIQNPPSRTCKVIGTKGMILIDLLNSTFQRFNFDGTLLENLNFTNFVRNQMFIDELEHFLDCVDKRINPDITLIQSALSLQIALATKKSLSSNEVIELIPKYTNE